MGGWAVLSGAAWWRGPEGVSRRHSSEEEARCSDPATLPASTPGTLTHTHKRARASGYVLDFGHLRVHHQGEEKLIISM